MKISWSKENKLKIILNRDDVNFAVKGYLMTKGFNLDKNCLHVPDTEIEAELTIMSVCEQEIK